MRTEQAIAKEWDRETSGPAGFETSAGLGRPDEWTDGIATEGCVHGRWRAHATRVVGDDGKADVERVSAKQ